VYLKRSLRVGALVPTVLVTVTSTAPFAPGGDTAWIELDDVTVKLSAFAAPNLTAVVPAKEVPVMVTAVPPAEAPRFGDTLVTVGASGVRRCLH
jgi:hypothetical protein